MDEITAYPETSPIQDTRWTIAANPPAYDYDIYEPPRPQNVSDTERWASALGGSALVLLGLKRGSLMGLLAGLAGGSLVYRGWTGHCHMYEALGINTQERNPATAVPAQQGVKIERTIAVNRSPEDLYAFWRYLKNLPRVMRHLERIEELDETRSHWFAKGPFGKSIEWRAEIITDRDPDVISWRSLEGGDVDTAGSVHFKRLSDERGTAVTISLKYDPPGGKLGATIASLLGQGLEQELDEDLHRFKSLMEAGEVPTVQGQSHG